MGECSLPRANLVFQGQGTGEFAAFVADSGKQLWSIKTGSAIESIPVTFSLKGEQYVITPVGWGSDRGCFAPARTMVTNESARGPVRLLSFKLGATAAYSAPPVVIPSVPEPPKLMASQETIQKGEVLYQKFVCDGCHSRVPTAAAPGCWTARFPICATCPRMCIATGMELCWAARTGIRGCRVLLIRRSLPSLTPR